MKNCCSSAPRFALFTIVAVAAAMNARAQTNTFGPIVTLRASDPSASESGDPGVFAISREGATNYDLRVFYHIGGSASNGVDYAQIPSGVVIPAGIRRVEIPIQPKDDSLVEGDEIVELQLIPSPLECPTPPCGYYIGSPSNGVVVIHDNDGPPPTNQPPTVHIVSPTNGATFFSDWYCPPCTTNTPPCEVPCYLVGPNINICADARDADGYVDRVEFYAGTYRIGARTNCLPCASIQNPFCLVWSNVPPGNYALTAKATDNSGATSSSDPVNVTVRQDQPHMPIVAITATDPNATEPCPASNPPTVLDTGRFTVRRDSGTNVAFTVYYTVSGTASNGVDYAALSGSVEIPAGRYEANILVSPLADTLAEGLESVVLKLQPIACIAIFPPPPDCYQLGTPSEAAAYIRDCEQHVTNAPPKVHITAPTNGAVFVAPVGIAIATDTVDADGYVTRVEFFANDHKIGEDSKQFFVAPTNGSHIGYEIVWTNPPPGLYSLKATATDNVGATGFSEPVRITVMGSNPPPETNRPPVVTISAADAIAAEGTNCWRWYTNTAGGMPMDCCRTNTATFVVRRTGTTNSSLTVNYAIAGSASNSVDYATIPDSVTIPAGERSVRIVINPVDDTTPECNETVVLRLLSPSNTPPDYVVGWPGKAAAVIEDNDQPPPRTSVLCDGIFHLGVPASNGFNYRLEMSLDLKHWLPVCTNTVTDAGVHFADPETDDFPTRFYRVVTEPNSPAP